MKDVEHLHPNPETPASCIFTAGWHDGTRIVTGSLDRTARIWDAATSQALTTLSGHLIAVRSVAYSPDGTRIVTSSADKTARI